MRTGMDGFINCGFVVALHCHLETEHFIVSHKEKKKKWQHCNLNQLYQVVLSDVPQI